MNTSHGPVYTTDDYAPAITAEKYAPAITAEKYDRAMLPDATPEELFRVVSEAMNRTPLGGSQPPAGGRKH